MDAKLHTFFDSINFDNNCYQLFENAQLVKASYSKTTQKYTVEINLEYLIDVRVFQILLEACNKTLNSVSMQFHLVNKPTQALINEYYKYFVSILYKGGVLKDTLMNLPVEIEDDSICVTCSLDTIYDNLIPLKDNLQILLNKVGINLNLNIINVNSFTESSFDELIEQEAENVVVHHVSSSSFNAEEADYKKTEDRDFYKKGYSQVLIKDIQDDDRGIEFSGEIFSIEEKTARNGVKRYTIYVYDGTGSIVLRTRNTDKISSETLSSLKEGMHISVKGDMIQYDRFYTEPYFAPRFLAVLPTPEKRTDNAETKRVELHLHTNMSAMDGIPSAEEYIKTAIRFGHKAIAFTDHGVCQAYPEAQNAAYGKDIKLIYGLEGYICNNKKIPAHNPTHTKLRGHTYVVFDLETTGLSREYDKIIELGFVKYRDGEIIETFQSFINPLCKLEQTIIDLTGITNDMLISAPTIQEMMPKILEFISDSILIAHNGTFDVGFLNAELEREGKPQLTNCLIDTLDVAHCIYPKLKNYKLGTICKSLNIDYDDEDAHRADYDATVLARLWGGMMDTLYGMNIEYADELNSLSPENSYKSERPFHMTFLVKNDIGLKNLYKLVSMSHIDYIAKVPLIPRYEIEPLREGLLIGSACFNGEIFDIAQTQTKKELKEAMKFYDYIEIQPLANYKWLLDTKRILSEERLIQILKGIIECAQELGKLIVATGDCHYIEPEDKIYRDVYVVTTPVGGGFHPLSDKRCNRSPEQHFRTTQEMIDGISYVGDLELQKQFVVTNTNLIADMIEQVYPVKPQTFTPKLDYVDADQEIRDMCHKRAHELYGENLPKIVEERMENELNNIISNGYGVIYYLAYRLVKKSNEDGRLVGSRGSVGSSFVASLCKITEVNPLAPHYLCPRCHHSEFFEDGSVRSGFDLPEKKCPECGAIMHGNGQNIPFETFLGIKGDKCPDIDLNFARDYQATAHEYTKVLCGENNVFRAGTISTVAEKTAFGYARGYFEAHGIENPKEADLRRLAIGCRDVKRTTGQHPAGIVVIPNEYDIYDFTPIQYPADETGATWKTTHFNFKSMHDELLKLDILGHLDPMALKMLKDITGVDPETIPMNDPGVLALFTSLDSIGVKADDVLNTVGSSGVPEFGTSFVKGVLLETKPVKFSDLVQISGLTHGTDVYNDNAQTLIKDGTCTLTEVIGCRDDIMSDLMLYGMDKKLAFDIMEYVRKGKPTKEPAKWPGYVEKMKEYNVPEWYIESCHKIQYMFPKAHAVAYVVMALRVAWYKVHMPLYYYAAYFSVRCVKFDIASMIKGHEACLDKLKELNAKIKNKSATKIEEDTQESIELATEMTARGYHFENLSIEKSDAVNFIVDEPNKALIPPFIVIDGLGEAVARSIVDARNEKPFTSKEDLIERTQINKTQIKVLEEMKCLEKLVDKNQLTFDLGLD